MSNSHQPKQYSNRYWMALIVSIVIVIVSVSLWYALRANEDRNIRISTENSLELIASELQGEVESRALGIMRIAERWAFRGKLTKAEWEADAKLYVRHFPGIQGILWIDPLKTIRWVVPFIANQHLQNIDVSENQALGPALDVAKKRHRPIITDTMELRRGGKGFYVLSPIFHKNVFEGYIAGVFRTGKLFKVMLANVAHDYAISIYDSHNQLLFNRGQAVVMGQKQWTQSATLKHRGVQWKVVVVPSQKLVDEARTFYPWVVLVAGVMVAILFMWASINSELAKKQATKILHINEELNQEVVERKQVEELLQRSKERLNLALKASEIGTWNWTMADDQFVWDDYMHPLFGLKPGTFKGTYSDFLKFIHPEDMKRIKNEIETAIKEGNALDSECRIIKIDQSTHFIGLRGRVYRDPKGSPTHMTGVCWDMTKSKQAEEEIRQTNVFLDSIIENLPDMIFIKEADGLRFVRFNKAGEQLTGYTRDEFFGKNDYDFFPKEEADFFTRKDREVLHGEGVTDILEEKIHTKHKGVRTLHTKKIPIHDAEGNPKYLLGISEDITERKRVQEQIEGMRTAMEHALEGISRLDTDGNYVMVNKAYGDLMGYAPEEMLGMSWKSSVHSRDLAKAEEAYQTMLHRGKAEFQARGIRKDDSIFNKLVVMVKITDEKGAFTGHHCFIRDITERKYKESLEIKSELISMVAHELRTPLHAIMEGVSILLEELTGPVNNEQKDVLQTTKRSVDRLGRLVNSVLDFQKLEAGIVEFELQKDNVNEMILEAKEEFLPLAKSKHIELKTKLTKDIPNFDFDRDRIKQVVINLLNNALKFTEKGSITVVTEKEENFVRISVKDTGIGIKREEEKQLFRKFGQLESGKIRSPGGTGLGLVISKNIVERHQGKMWCESEYNKGSIFSFTLPISRNLAGLKPSP